MGSGGDARRYADEDGDEDEDEDEDADEDGVGGGGMHDCSGAC